MQQGHLLRGINKSYFRASEKLNAKSASELARSIYGPAASAARVSSLDRSQRFAISMVEPGGVQDAPLLVILGYGDSFESALKHAESNPAAQMASDRFKSIKDAYESGKFANPQEYVDEVLKMQLKEKINGTNKASERVEGSTGEGPGNEVGEERKVVL